MGTVAKSQVERLVSAGGVVYRRLDGGIQAVLCGRHVPTIAVSKSTQQGVKKSVRWSLAKGTPDAGETLEETAIREVREETGLEVEIGAPIGSIEYWFTERGSKVRFHKTVHFYLMLALGGDTDQHDPEFDVVEWFPYEEAVEAVGYANEAEVLRKALELIPNPSAGTNE